MTTTELPLVKELALAGGGIAVLPLEAVERDLAEGRLSRVLARYVVEPALSLYLVHLSARFLTPKVSAFRDFMLGSFGVAGRRLGGGSRRISNVA